MNSRISSLFALDALLVPLRRVNGNGHSAATRPRKRHKKQRAAKQGEHNPPAPNAAAPIAPSAKPAPATPAPVAQSFDAGAPIRCQHGVAYAPTERVELPEQASADESADPPQLTDADESHAASYALQVEAFDQSDEEPDDDDGPRLSLSHPDEGSHDMPHGTSLTPSRPARQVQDARYETAAPRAFAAQMSAVERDLADLAGRVQSLPSDKAGAEAPGADADDSPAPTAAPPAPASGHGVFDAMGKGMSYATEFRLPSVQLSQVFSALDRHLDAGPAIPMPPTGGTQVLVPPSDDALPSNEVLLGDLTSMRPPAAPVVSAAGVGPLASAAAAIDVRHTVQLVPQQTGYSCWAAGAAMLAGWRDRMSIDPSQIASATGYWAQYAAGLHPEDTTMFRAWRLTPEPSTSYTVAGFAALLRRHGPLWVASAEPGPHIRVVTGMVGDGTPNGTLVYINDPWETGMAAFRLPNSGAQYSETYQRFVEKQETLARQESALHGIYVAHN